MQYIGLRRGQTLVHRAGKALGRASCQGKGLEPKKKEMEDPQLVSVDVTTLDRRSA